MNVRYVYKPEVKDIYLYKGVPVVIEDPAYGHVTIWTLDGKFIDAPGQYEDEVNKAWDIKIGKVIKPRWNKEYQTWETSQRGLKYDQIFHNGPDQRY